MKKSSNQTHEERGGFRVRAVFMNEAGAFAYTYYDERFASEDEAMEWINGEEGELAAESATIDSRNDADLEGFWLDDFEVLAPS